MTERRKLSYIFSVINIKEIIVTYTGAKYPLISSKEIKGFRRFDKERDIPVLCKHRKR